MLTKSMHNFQWVFSAGCGAQCSPVPKWLSHLVWSLKFVTVPTCAVSRASDFQLKPSPFNAEVMFGRCLSQLRLRGDFPVFFFGGGGVITWCFTIGPSLFQSELFFHRVWSNASCFNFLYRFVSLRSCSGCLLLLLRLPFTHIFLHIF